MSAESAYLETATVAGGCFWCLEAAFSELKGVKRVVSGYSGGSSENPTYREVCTGTTGHAEAVQITFDPKDISYGELLEVFFTIHDPTTLNRQGGDIGTQYRSAIFFHNDEQKKTAEELMQQFETSRVWNDPIVTELHPFRKFYAAEGYHQEYYKKNAEQPYCRLVIEPKVAKLRKKFFDKLQK